MERIRLSARLRSFKYAWEGVVYLFRTQHNIWIHITLAIIVITLGFVFEIGVIEWCMVAFAIGIVFVAEAFNTALEVLVDFVSPEYDDKAKIVKDVGAAGVLFAAIAALVIGVIVFGERVWMWVIG